MIGKLKGIVDSFGDEWVILDVGGVGYQVFCSSRTLQRLPRAGAARDPAHLLAVLLGFLGRHDADVLAQVHRAPVAIGADGVRQGQDDHVKSPQTIARPDRRIPRPI